MENVALSLLNFVEAGNALTSFAALSLTQVASLMTTAHAAVTMFLDSDGDALGIYAILIGGPAFYGYVYLRYRNVNQRHTYEQETPTEISNLQQYDNYLQQIKRQSSPNIPGANDQIVTGSLLGGQSASGLSETVINLAMKTDIGRNIANGDFSAGTKRDVKLTAKLKERKRSGR